MGFKGFWQHVLRWRVLDYIAIIIIALAPTFGTTSRQPHCRAFDWNDPSINHPMTPSIIPGDWLTAMILLPPPVMMIGEVLTRWWRPLEPARTRHHRSSGRWQSALLHMNGWVVVHFYGYAFSSMIMNIAKLYAGRLRPDFIARLAAEGITNDGSFDSLKTNDKICAAAREGRVSFPSGHASISFSCIMPLCLYLLGLCRQLGRRGNLMVTTVCFAPLVLPFAVGISRTIDYHHHFSDVVAGALLGVVSAVFAVGFLFRASDTGEWTLHAHPVETRDVVPMTADERSRCSARCLFNFCDVCCVSDGDLSGDEDTAEGDADICTGPKNRKQSKKTTTAEPHGANTRHSPSVQLKGTASGQLEEPSIVEPSLTYSTNEGNSTRGSPFGAHPPGRSNFEVTGTEMVDAAGNESGVNSARERAVSV